MIDAEYVLPLKWGDDSGLPELCHYLDRLADLIDVTVVDGSSADRFAAHAAAFGPAVRQLAPEPWPGRNGKVAGVMTGVRAARHGRVVLADDDVRYDRDRLERVVALLDDADLVRPQSVFHPAPWHARWDTARTLVNRAFGADYPGTFALRRSTLLAAGGYDGDVLFENLELIRTVRAFGGRCLSAPEIVVPRRPPTTRHFLGQRVRQAYDDFAQPTRLVAELLILPALAALAAPKRGRVTRLLLAAAAALMAVAVAEVGRRRAGGARVFPPTAALWAPVWLIERAVCAWIAVGCRLRGGVNYGGHLLKRAATPQRVLRARARSAAQSDSRLVGSGAAIS